MDVDPSVWREALVSRVLSRLVAAGTSSDHSREELCRQRFHIVWRKHSYVGMETEGGLSRHE